jgi:hypothetical protein
MTTPSQSPHPPESYSSNDDVIIIIDNDNGPGDTTVRPIPPERRGVVLRSFTLPEATWEKLVELARQANVPGAPPVTVSDIAARLLEQALNGK